MILIIVTCKHRLGGPFCLQGVKDTGFDLFIKLFYLLTSLQCFLLMWALIKLGHVIGLRYRCWLFLQNWENPVFLIVHLQHGTTCNILKFSSFMSVGQFQTVSHLTSRCSCFNWHLKYNVFYVHVHMYVGMYMYGHLCIYIHMRACIGVCMN